MLVMHDFVRLVAICNENAEGQCVIVKNQIFPTQTSIECYSRLAA